VQDLFFYNAEDFELAHYNPLFIPGFIKHNKYLVEVEFPARKLQNQVGDLAVSFSLDRNIPISLSFFPVGF